MKEITGLNTPVDENVNNLIDKFMELWDVMESLANEDEYYDTCESIFEGIERKHLDVSKIIPEKDYETFKQNVLKADFPCPSIGNRSNKQYKISTSEGWKEFTKDYPNERLTV